jgi:hypothetical protein
MSAAERPPNTVPHRVGFFLVALLLLSLVALLPFVLTGVVEDIDQTGNPTYPLYSDYDARSSTRTHANLDVTQLDEWRRAVTIQVSGHHVCDTPCSWDDRLMLVSIPPPREDGEGLPPMATVDFRPTSLAVSQSITLPVFGAPIRYPFDHYTLRVGVVLQRVYADGTTQTFTPQEADGHLFLSVNGFIPRAHMNRPISLNLNKIFVDDPAYQYVYAADITFDRPLYLRVITVFLVLLVTAAASYAVFLRPLNELVINAGALVLGVWGIRAVLLGADVPGFTAVDLSLMTVILFLLAAITWRALVYLRDRGQVPVRLPARRRRRPARPDAPATDPREHPSFEPGD